MSFIFATDYVQCICGCKKKTFHVFIPCGYIKCCGTSTRQVQVITQFTKAIVPPITDRSSFSVLKLVRQKNSTSHVTENLQSVNLTPDSPVSRN